MVMSPEHIREICRYIYNIQVCSPVLYCSFLILINISDRVNYNELYEITLCRMRMVVGAHIYWVRAPCLALV
jgi:hypothetical protein